MAARVCASGLKTLAPVKQLDFHTMKRSRLRKRQKNVKFTMKGFIYHCNCKTMLEQEKLSNRVDANLFRRPRRRKKGHASNEHVHD